VWGRSSLGPPYPWGTSTGFQSGGPIRLRILTQSEPEALVAEAKVTAYEHRSAGSGALGEYPRLGPSGLKRARFRLVRLAGNPSRFHQP